MSKVNKSRELTIEDIKKLIPHRYPFLLVDKIIDIIPFESATGIKNVTINENFFQGHFESKAVMPGALIIESMAQSAGSLVLHSLNKSEEKISVFLLSINKAKFRKQVCPGDVLIHKVFKKNQVKNIWKFSCKSYVNNSLVAEAELSAILDEN